MAAQVSLFVYGTLLDDARVRAVTGRTFPRRPARLDGYRREWPAESHPYLVPEPGASVDGAVLDGIDARALAALDRYEDEGRLYVRSPAVVTVGGAAVACQVYQARCVPG